MSDTVYSARNTQAAYIISLYHIAARNTYTHIYIYVTTVQQRRTRYNQTPNSVLAKLWRKRELNLYLNNLSIPLSLPFPPADLKCTSASVRTHPPVAHYLPRNDAAHEFRCATNKRTFLDISRPPERALALINFVAATKTEELITSFSMHSRESFSLAFPELAPYISSRLSSYIEIRESIPTDKYPHIYTHTPRCTDHIVGARDCRT